MTKSCTLDFGEIPLSLPPLLTIVLGEEAYAAIASRCYFYGEPTDSWRGPDYRRAFKSLKRSTSKMVYLLFN